MEPLEQLESHLHEALAILSRLLISKSGLNRDALHALFSQLLDVQDQLNELQNEEEELE